MKIIYNNFIKVLLIIGVLIFTASDFGYTMGRPRYSAGYTPRPAPVPVNYYQQGLNYLNSGDYRNAINSFNTELSRNPNNTQAYLNRATAYQKTGNTAAAISDFTRVISLNPRNTQALLMRADLFVKTGNNSAAIGDFSSVLAREPRNSRALLTRAELYKKAGNNAAAIADFARAIALNPIDSNSYFNIGEIYYKDNNYAEAERYLNRARELGNTSPDLVTYVNNIADRRLADEISRAAGESARRSADLQRAIPAFAAARQAYQNEKGTVQRNITALQNRKNYLTRYKREQYRQWYQPVVDNYNSTKRIRDGLVQRRNAAQVIVDAAKRRETAMTDFQNLLRQGPPKTYVRRGWFRRGYYTIRPEDQIAFNKTLVEKKVAYDRVVRETSAILSGSPQEIQNKVNKAKSDVVKYTTDIANYERTLKGMEQQGSSYMNAVGMLKRLENDIQQTDRNIQAERGKLAAIETRFAQAQGGFNTAKASADNADKKLMELRGIQVMTDIARGLSQTVQGDTVKIVFDPKQNAFVGSITGKNNAEVGKIKGAIDKNGNFSLNIGTNQGQIAAATSGNIDKNGNYRAIVNHSALNPSLSGAQYQGNMNDPKRTNFTKVVSEKMKPVLRGAAAQRAKAAAVLDKAVGEKAKISQPGVTPAGVHFTDQAPVGSAKEEGPKKEQ